MKFYVLESLFQKPFESFGEIVPQHRAWLQQWYDKGICYARGRSPTRAVGSLLAVPRMCQPCMRWWREILIIVTAWRVTGSASLTRPNKPQCWRLGTEYQIVAGKILALLWLGRFLFVRCCPVSDVEGSCAAAQFPEAHLRENLLASSISFSCRSRSARASFSAFSFSA